MSELHQRADGSYLCPKCGEANNLYFIGSTCVGCERCTTSVVPPLWEVEKRRDEWQQTALQQARNADYYCGLLDQIADLIGPEAAIAEDGTTRTDPVYARLPALVAARLGNRK